jgi:hypothetical protein
MSRHVCHAIGCERAVKPELLMCRLHWFMVPARLRVAVLRTYRTGQCDDKQPSREWLAAALAARNAVYELESKPKIIYSCELP